VNAPAELAAEAGGATALAAALGAVDVVVPEQAAKMTDKVTADTEPLIDHLFGAWDMLRSPPLGSRRTTCLPVRPVERA
jgi:hypothetical protein